MWFFSLYYIKFSGLVYFLVGGLYDWCRFEVWKFCEIVLKILEIWDEFGVKEVLGWIWVIM